MSRLIALLSACIATFANRNIASAVITGEIRKHLLSKIQSGHSNFTEAEFVNDIISFYPSKDVIYIGNKILSVQEFSNSSHSVSVMGINLSEPVETTLQRIIKNVEDCIDPVIVSFDMPESTVVLLASHRITQSGTWYLPLPSKEFFPRLDNRIQFLDFTEDGGIDVYEVFSFKRLPETRRATKIGSWGAEYLRSNHFENGKVC